MTRDIQVALVTPPRSSDPHSSPSGFCLQTRRRTRKVTTTDRSRVGAFYDVIFCASHCFPEGRSGDWEAVFGTPEGKANCLSTLVSTGAGEEIRTLDPNLGKVVLYH